MKQIIYISLIALLFGCCFCENAFAQEKIQKNFFEVQVEKKEEALELKQPKFIESEIKEEKPRTLMGKIWKYSKGEPVQDSVLLGMWSKHTSPNRHLRNDTNDIFAMQYKGISLGTFNNSYHSQTYFIAFARKLCKKQLTKNTSIDLQYKAGIMHGYKDKYVNIDGTAPVILPSIGFDYKMIGFDLWVIPSTDPIFSINTRLNTEWIKNSRLNVFKRKTSIL